tara:strand:- start:1127 stop:1669 length:543 start_codon:yes stop_codon:yes gene_type:complete
MSFLFGTPRKKNTHTYYGQSKNADNMTRKELEEERERWRKEAERVARIKRRNNRKNKTRKKGPPLPRRRDGRWDMDAVYKPQITDTILAPLDSEDAHKDTMRPKLGKIDDYSDTGAGASTTKKRTSLTEDMRKDLVDPFEFMGGKTRKRRRKRRRKTKRKGRRKTKKRRKRRKRKTRRKR